MFADEGGRMLDCVKTEDLRRSVLIRGDPFLRLREQFAEGAAISKHQVTDDDQPVVNRGQLEAL
jgi:hypothetical protein